MPMRLPVTSSRRCEQITAFGASDVPLVKMSAQIVSTDGLEARVGRSSYAGERGVEASPDLEHRRQLVRDRREQLAVLGLGDHEPAVRCARCRAAGARRGGCGSARRPPRRRAPRRRTRRGTRACCRAAPRRAAAGPSGSRSRKRLAHRHDSATYSPWVQTRSSNRTAGRAAIVRIGGVAAQQRGRVRRRGAAPGPGRGAARRGRGFEPDIGVTLRGSAPATVPSIVSRARPATGRHSRERVTFDGLLIVMVLAVAIPLALGLFPRLPAARDRWSRSWPGSSSGPRSSAWSSPTGRSRCWPSWASRSSSSWPASSWTSTRCGAGRCASGSSAFAVSVGLGLVVTIPLGLADVILDPLLVTIILSATVARHRHAGAEGRGPGRRRRSARS